MTKNVTVTKDEWVQAAVALGLYPTKTAARAVPVAKLREEVEAHDAAAEDAAAEDAANALDEAVWAVQHTEPTEALKAEIRAEEPPVVKLPTALLRALHEARALPSRNRHERRVREARLRLAQRAIQRTLRAA